MGISLKIYDAAGGQLAEAVGEKEVSLFYDKNYEVDDRIVLEIEETNAFYWVKFDDAMEKSLVYLTGAVTYRIPFAEARLNISPRAFAGDRHLLWVKKAADFEVAGYRNLALNTYDQHGIETQFPHALANVETRGESVFAAQNAIDGVTINTSHGEWPYQSWGINRQDDAKIRISFGREVTVDRIVLYTRADFPHDNWWEQVSFTFSDGSSLDMQIEKSVLPHELTFGKRTITWVEMHDMKKADDPSPFPALTQIEVYGWESRNDGEKTR